MLPSLSKPKYPFTLGSQTMTMHKRDFFAFDQVEFMPDCSTRKIHWCFNVCVGVYLTCVCREIKLYFMGHKSSSSCATLLPQRIHETVLNPTTINTLFSRSLQFSWSLFLRGETTRIRRRPPPTLQGLA